jgi:predicted TIM-barrel fold metal-dependent hydrolase
MRNMAAVIGSGAMDRYPQLRVGCLEAGHSWLPFWCKRLDEHALTIRSALPPLEHTPSEYVTSGRYFQSIEMSEGPELTQMVADQLGDGVLMYASDYPHGESWFPRSVDTVMEWRLPAELKQKLFWDNPLRFYRRYAGVTAAPATV